MSSELLRIDEKWSVEYDPSNNDKPGRTLRYGEPVFGGSSDWKNDALAMFYALIDRDARIEALEAENACLREALEPFAAVAEHDIGDDETDDDIFWPISNARYSMSGRLRVGHLRAARRAREGGNNA